MGHHLPHHVSPCPCCHGLVLRGFIYWAHGTSDDRRFPAVGSTVALLNVQHQFPTFSTVHPFLRLVFLSRLISQALVHRRCIHNLAHVHEPIRIPASFQLAHQLVCLLAIHQRYKFTPQPSVTVLSAQTSPVFFHNACRLLSHLSEQPSAFLRLDVDYRSEMQFAS